MISDDIKVSVIVPVFNVLKYIDKCIASVVNQTFEMWELILIDDGSSDGSEVACDMWSKKDRRIRCIHQKNAGLGPTRMKGIEEAKGKYIFFLDSDDWISEKALELLYEKAEDTDSDIVICDMCLYDERNPDKKTILQMPVTIEPYTNAGETPELLYACDTATCNKLYKKDLWEKGKLIQPAHPYEDMSVVNLLTILADRISQVQETLYFYRQNREGNITGEGNNVAYMIQGIEELYQNAVSLNLDKKWEKELNKFALWNYKNANYHTKDFVQNDKYINELKVKLTARFPKWNKISRTTWTILGSCNLKSILWNILEDNAKIIHQQSFSSLMSLDNKKGRILDEICKLQTNEFRRNMIANDMLGEYGECLHKETGSQYIAIDFLEEANDLCLVQDEYYTISECWVEGGGTT